MSETAEDQLIALISKEQRGLRRILFSGFAALFLVIAMSVALGAYYYSVTQTLEMNSKRLDKQAFDTRRRVDRQANQAAVQELAIRRAYDEIRKDDLPETTLETTDAALEAASIFLKRGGRSLASERLIESTASQTDIGAERYLFEGVAAVLTWDRNGDQILRGAKELPGQLQTAEAAFLKAIEQPDLYHLGQNGLAWLSFEYASSPASNYTPADCEAVFNLVDASAQNGQLGPQPLYWRAQCERKLGRAKEAMRDYALALSRAREIDQTSHDERRDASERMIEMNAYHGVGTVLIATADEPEDADLKEARALAAEACQPDENTPGKTALTQLAHACLGKAISLRERLGQTKNQVSGTRENISFAFLRDDNFEGAYDNTVIVEETGLFAWNELIRALSASHKNEPIIEREARRNVLMFDDATSFNLCEIQTLLNPVLFEEARTIVEEEYPEFELDCS